VAVTPISRFKIAIKSLVELGPRKTGLYSLYRVGLWVGYYKFRTPVSDIFSHSKSFDLRFLPRQILDLPDPAEVTSVIGEQGLTALIQKGIEILDGQVRLFGGKAIPLHLALEEKLYHWTDYETDKVGLSPSRFSDYPAADIKFIWEPARFGWAFTLARAYYLTGDERFTEAFWLYFEEFHRANLVNLGPNWVSAQEAALRIIAFAFCGCVFERSLISTKVRKNWLGRSIAAHARRVMATTIYAKAQNNNHALSEAAGLITASKVLSDHPEAEKWAETGWKWFNHGLDTQIHEDGSYIQHSMNYHRLMLQLALWVFALIKPEPLADVRRSSNSGAAIEGSTLTRQAVSKLERAIWWLALHVDRETGQAPNLGPNDGAYILPLTIQPFHDYRPVIQASARAFLGQPVFEAGSWDEMGLWLNIPIKDVITFSFADASPNPSQQKTGCGVLHHPRMNSWIYLRAVKFRDRPGHSDQLHTDLWWRGLNIAIDAGTYLYNGPPPWNNSLTDTAVHNTVMIDGLEQMTRAGRFLYLDRAQACFLSWTKGERDSLKKLSAQHDGYSKLGLLHTRSVSFLEEDEWLVEDVIHPIHPANPQRQHTMRFHWLLPDWEMRQMNSETGIRLRSPYGWISLTCKALDENNNPIKDLDVSITRAGKQVFGSGPTARNWGWFSPTYGMKIPAISFGVNCAGSVPLTFLSKWVFPEHIR
jgi:hypothetical protein